MNRRAKSAFTDNPVRGAQFAFDPDRAEASFGGVKLDLDPATCAVLQALLAAGGATVDAASLRQHSGGAGLWACVTRLNEALARSSPLAGYVVNFPGQGYQLVQAPAPDARVMGRAAELARVDALLQAHRFVTIVGPGGMGKTTLARAVVTQSTHRYPDGVRFIDLAILAEGRAMPSALGVALGIEQLTRDGLGQLAAVLRDRRMLIVFDCCEHHAGVAAQAGEALLRAGPGIDVLCTSREPLLAHGERIVRLGPIGWPGIDVAPGARAAARFPAVALFVARANLDHAAGFHLDHANVGLVCAICRAVEGVPLALELAAALVRPLGLEALARQTSQRLLAPASGPAHPRDRHRTIASMLDWSYNALAPHEQRVFHCLAVFRGGFTLEAAGALAAFATADVTLSVTLDVDSVLDTVIELAGKSLVSMHGDGGAHRPRLLDITRAYAFDKLVGSGELRCVQAAHARWLRSVMERLERDWMTMPRSSWVDTYGPWVDDVLAAIDWALGPGDDVELAAYLAGVGFSLGDQLGVAREFHDCVQRAIKAMGYPDNPSASIVPVLLRLNAVNADGRDLSGHSFQKLMRDADRNLALARTTGSPLVQASPLTAMWGWPYVRGNYPAALDGARHIAQEAQVWADPYLELIGQRTMAQSLHFMGHHTEAHDLARLALSNSSRRIPLAYQPSPVQVATSARIVLARILWMAGAADQALAVSEEALGTAEGDRPVALCQALSLCAVPVAFWRGELPRAAQLIKRLRQRAEGHGLGYWIDWARRFEDALAVIQGDEARRAPPLDDTQEFSAKCRDHLVTFSPLLLTDDAIARCAAGMVGWCMPEVLRGQALRRLHADALDRDGAAAGWLTRSLAMALAQGAPGWALRSATALASLHARQGKPLLARAALEPVLAQCREGQGTADLRAALAVMASVG